jgi:hypothetical protein
MKKFILAILVGGAALTSAVTTASAQRYLDDYRGREINSVKDSLRYQGFRDAGRISNRRGSYALMFDGRTCIALHGSRGVIDEIATFDPRDCDPRRGPPPPPPRGYGAPPPPPPGWGPPPPPRY